MWMDATFLSLRVRKLVFALICTARSYRETMSNIKSLSDYDESTVIKRIEWINSSGRRVDRKSISQRESRHDCTKSELMP